MLIGVISVKLGTNSRHVSGHWALLKRFSRSWVKGQGQGHAATAVEIL